jgi:hypothetical protein
MEDWIVEDLLERITREWSLLNEEHRPWGVWIRQYPPIADDVDMIGRNSLVPVRAWFLDATGCPAHNVWEYQRFIAVQFDQLWCSNRNWQEPSLIRSNIGHWEIGEAAFAPYQNGRDYYYDWHFGGLCGRGYRLNQRDHSKTFLKADLWVS